MAFPLAPSLGDTHVEDQLAYIAADDGTGTIFWKRDTAPLTASIASNATAIAAVPAVIDEDDFATDSDARPASQQSAKAYVDNSVVTIDHLKSAAGVLNPEILAHFVSGDVLRTASYFQDSDLGGTTYRVVGAGTGTDDGGSFIDVDGARQLQAVFGSSFDVTQFGAVGDSTWDGSAWIGTDDTIAVQAAVSLASSTGKDLTFSVACLCTEQLDLDRGGFAMIGFGDETGLRFSWYDYDTATELATRDTYLSGVSGVDAGVPRFANLAIRDMMIAGTNPAYSWGNNAENPGRSISEALPTRGHGFRISNVRFWRCGLVAGVVGYDHQVSGVTLEDCARGGFNFYGSPTAGIACRDILISNSTARNMGDDCFAVHGHSKGTPAGIYTVDVAENSTTVLLAGVDPGPTVVDTWVLLYGAGPHGGQMLAKCVGHSAGVSIELDRPAVSSATGVEMHWSEVMMAEGVSITGCTIEQKPAAHVGLGEPSNTGRGIMLEAVVGATITGNSIRNTSDSGIALLDLNGDVGVWDSAVTGNSILGAGSTTTFGVTAESHGVAASSAGRCVLDNVSVMAGNCGVALKRCTSVTVKGLYSDSGITAPVANANLRYGVHVESSFDVDIHATAMGSGRRGMNVTTSAGTSIRNSRSVGNGVGVGVPAAARQGVFIQDSTDSLLIDSIIGDDKTVPTQADAVLLFGTNDGFTYGRILTNDTIDTGAATNVTSLDPVDSAPVIVKLAADVIKVTDTDTTSASSISPILSPVLEPGEYEFEFTLLYESSDVADIQTIIRRTSGTTSDFVSFVDGAANWSDATPEISTPRFFAHSDFGSTVSAGGAAGIVLPLKWSGRFVADTATEFGLYWAQRVSSADSTTLKAGSYLKVTRIA